MKYEDVVTFLKLPEGLPISNFQFYGSGRAPPIYQAWETKLETAIREGNISIDQVLYFFYNNGNKNRDFKVDGNLKRFWEIFYRDHQAEFF